MMPGHGPRPKVRPDDKRSENGKNQGYGDPQLFRDVAYMRECFYSWVQIQQWCKQELIARGRRTADDPPPPMRTVRRWVSMGKRLLLAEGGTDPDGIRERAAIQLDVLWRRCEQSPGMDFEQLAVIKAQESLIKTKVWVTGAQRLPTQQVEVSAPPVGVHPDVTASVTAAMQGAAAARDADLHAQLRSMPAPHLDD